MHSNRSRTSRVLHQFCGFRASTPAGQKRVGSNDLHKSANCSGWPTLVKRAWSVTVIISRRRRGFFAVSSQAHVSGTSAMQRWSKPKRKRLRLRLRVKHLHAKRPPGNPPKRQRPATPAQTLNRTPVKQAASDFSVESALVVLVGDLVLVLEEPVDGRFVVHGLVNRFCHGFAVDLEECFVVEVVAGDDAGV